ncbi:MAG: hypothetical protein ACFFEL_00725 [Candidatus Thorarchaeota archaeon]
MEIFTTLNDAKESGKFLARCGHFPTIYKRYDKEYILVSKGEWPPKMAWPFLKWDGEDWLPVLARLDTLEEAFEATGLFVLLGHQPVVVEFPGITFDIFLKESHVPTGAWIISEADPNCAVKYLKPPSWLDDDEDSVEISVQSP